MFIKRLPLALLVMAFVACSPWNKAPTNSGVAYFDVSFMEGTDIGTPSQPLAEQDIYTFHINITAMGYDNEPITDYNGFVEIAPYSATLDSYSRVELEDGVYENLTVKLRYAADHEVISVHEVEQIDNDGLISYKPTGKVGVSEKIYLPHTTIHKIQSITNNNAKNGFLSRFDKRNLTLGNWMVVTAVLEGGFYIHELGCEEYCDMYIYSHSTPFVDDGNDTMALQVGTILESVNASVQEFFGFTEMSFPTWKIALDENGRIVRDDVDDKGRPLPDAKRLHIPDPVDITEFVKLQDNESIEKYESGLVTVKNLTVDDFDEHEESYIEYSQYPLLTTVEDTNTDGTVTISNGPPIMTATISTAPTFAPVASKGKKLESITGILKQHRASRPSTWIIIPRDINDIKLAKE